MKVRVALAGFVVLAIFGAEVSAASANYPATVLQDNPRHYWRMDDGNTTMLDSSSDAQKKNGSHVNGPASVAGQAGSARRYTSSNDFSNIEQNETYDAFSVEFWIRTTDSASNVTNWWQGKGLVDSDSPVAGHDDFGVSLANDGKIAVGIGSDPPTVDPTKVSSKSVNDGLWHHVVAQYNVTSLLIYVDGQLDGSQSVNPTDVTRSITGITIGQIRTGGGEVSADLDEIAVYPNAIPPERVAAHYNAGRAGNDSDGDGVPNDSDFCPSQQGPASQGGCPDSDGDGVVDPSDTCPEDPSTNSTGCPDAELVVYPSGSGRGNIYGPGFQCIDIGVFMGGAGDCREVYDTPQAVDLRAEPQPGSRFNSFSWNNLALGGTQTCGADCQAVAIPGTRTEMTAFFHLQRDNLARAVYDGMDGRDGSGNLIEGGLDDVVNPKKGTRPGSLNPRNVSIPACTVETGQCGGVLVTAASGSQKLIGLDGSSLQRQANKFFAPNGAKVLTTNGVPVTPNTNSLISDNGLGLIGLDGSSLLSDNGSGLLSDNGSGLIGNNGNTRSSRGQAAFRAKTHTAYVPIATFKTVLNNNVPQVSLEVTRIGEEFLVAWGKKNLERKSGKNPKSGLLLPASFIQLAEPIDGQSGGGGSVKLEIG
jgi:hypothetical protein